MIFPRPTLSNLNIHIQIEDTDKVDKVLCFLNKIPRAFKLRPDSIQNSWDDILQHLNFLVGRGLLSLAHHSWGFDWGKNENIRLVKLVCKMCHESFNNFLVTKTENVKDVWRLFNI